MRWLQALRFVSLLLIGLLAGVVLTHPLEIPGKAALSGAEWLSVQHHLYGGYAIFGAVAEIGGLIATLALGLGLAWKQYPRAALALLATVCMAGMLASFWLGLNPINQAVSHWTAASLPSNWADYRDHWNTLHTAAFGLSLLAFCSLIIEALAQE